MTVLPDRFAITPTGQQYRRNYAAAIESYIQRHKAPPSSMSLRVFLLTTLESPKTSEELLEYFTFPEKAWPKREERLQKAATRELNWLLSRHLVLKRT